MVFPFPGDQAGECRAHGNLGSAFFSKGNYREALTNHRNQLVLAMKLKDREARSMHGVATVHVDVFEKPSGTCWLSQRRAAK